MLMTDDLDMKALSGTLGQKATLSLEAGCDIILQCSGNIENIIEVCSDSK